MDATALDDLGLDLPGSPATDATPLGVRILKDAKTALSAEEGRLTALPPNRQDKDHLQRVRQMLMDVRERLPVATRRLADRRIGQYVDEEAALDRARQLETILGDVRKLGVDALVLAEEGRWEEASEKLKTAKARATDAARLAKVAAEVAIADARTGQLCLALDDDPMRDSLREAARRLTADGDGYTIQVERV